jgi:hypothetical protein
MRAASVIIAMTMEAASTSETSVNFNNTTWRNSPEDSRLHTRRLEDLNSHFNTSSLNYKLTGKHIFVQQV